MVSSATMNTVSPAKSWMKPWPAASPSIGHQDQREDTNEIGEDRNGNDEHADGQESRCIRSVPEIDVEKTNRGQADDRVQPRACGGDQKLIIGDLDGHSGACDRVAKPWRSDTANCEMPIFRGCVSKVTSVSGGGSATAR